MKLLAIAVCLLLFVAMAEASEPGPVLVPVSPKAMTRLCHLELNLIDKRNVGYFHFGKEGDVAVTFGIKNGYLCSPLMNWSLSKDGILTIKDGKEIMFKWTAIAFEKDKVYVQTEGKLEVYSIAKEAN